jgi:predicted transcriptional regulator of viral defense system
MNKGISYRSAEILNALISLKKDFFTLKEASNILSGSESATVRKLLSDMTKRGLIMRIKEGLYHPIPFEKDPGQYFPNWHLTADAIAQPKKYYIGFYSALDIYGLITQPSMVEMVVTCVQVKPKIQRVKNVRFEFITLNEKRFFGFKKQWIDDFHKVYCSDREKTFLDCLFKPDLAGGITEITKALYKSRENLQPARFQEYLVKYDTEAVYKRLGYILDLLELFPEVQSFIKGRITTSYTPLDPTVDKHGHYSAKWGIIDNIDFKNSLASLRT